MESQTESRVLTFNFPAALTVGEANEQIRERAHGDSVDMALFRVVETAQALAAAGKSDSRSGSFLGRKKDKKDKDETEVPFEPTGVWLKNNVTLDEYDLSTDDELIFRKKHKVVSVKTADEHRTAVIVDLTRPVKEVLVTIGQRFGLDRTEEYALQWERTGRFLKATKPITEQGNSNEVLVLRKRYYVTDAQLDANSPVQLHLAYIQGRDMVVSGLHPVTKEEVVQFAALQAQAQFGIFNPQTHKPGFLVLSEFVPPNLLKTKDLESLILHYWKGIGTMTTIEAKFKYHQLCMTLSTYGKTMYSVGYNEAPKGKKPNIVNYKLAFSATMIQQLTSDCKTIIRQHKYVHVKKWTHDENVLVIDFGDHDPQSPLTYFTTQGEEISQLISGYIDILVRINRAVRPDEEISGTVAEVQSMGTSKAKVSVGMVASSTGYVNQANQMLATISDLNSFHEAFHNYHVPTIKELAPPTGLALTSEQLSAQMDSAVVSMRKLMDEMQAAASVHNNQELTNLSKNLAMIVTNFLQDAQRAAALSKETNRKQHLLNSCETLVKCLETYSDALRAYEMNPCEATLATLEVAKASLENAIEAVVAAMRSHQVEPENGVLLCELAKCVAHSVNQMIETAKKSAAGNPEVEAACKAATDSCNELASTLNVLGQYAADPAMRDRIMAKMKPIKPSTANILQAVSQANPTAMPSVMAEMKNVDAELRQLQQALENTVLDVNKKYLPFYRAAHISVYDSAKIMAAPDNMNQVGLSTAHIRDCAPVIIARAKEMNDEVNEDGEFNLSHMNTLALARQIAIATKMLVTQTAPNAQVNPQLIQKSGAAVNQAVLTLLGDDEQVMHKVVLVDRAKLAAAGVLHLASLIRDNVESGKVAPEKAEAYIQRARGAFDAVQQLLAAVRQAVGSEGDERVNINHLAETSALFCQGAAANVIFPMNAEGPDYTEACATAGRDVQSLFEETQQYRIVGRLADIEYATESFRAAEAVLQALLFANDADRFSRFGTRDEALAQLPTAAAEFGNSLKSVAQAVKQSQSFIQPLQDLSRATNSMITVSRGVITNSRFKHERSLLVDAARELTIDVNKLVEALKRYAREDTNGVVDAVASSIAGAVSALQRIVAYAQNEGGQLVLEDGGEVTAKYDAELEAQAEETLAAVKEQVDSISAHISEVSASLPPPADPRSTVTTAVVDSVGALVASTGAVVGAAYEAQNELVVNLAQPTTRFAYARDPALADALIKAARHVQNAIMDLTRGLSADTVQTLSQNELATQASAVSKAVEILASAVRAGTKARSTSLMEATMTVSQATQSLLEAAKMIEELPTEEEDTDVENFGIDAYTLSEIKLQMKIAELEHMLERARKKYDTLMNTSSLVKTQWNVV